MISVVYCKIGKEGQGLAPCQVDGLTLPLEAGSPEQVQFETAQRESPSYQLQGYTRFATLLSARPQRIQRPGSVGRRTTTDRHGVEIQKQDINEEFSRQRQCFK